MVTEDILVAEKIAEKILLIDPDNQEAKLVQMTKVIKNNTLTELNSLRFDSARNKNDLLEFLFYQDKKIKTKSSIIFSWILSDLPTPIEMLIILKIITFYFSMLRSQFFSIAKTLKQFS